MREKELRLALVCYGGISLAVYMHGITKEVWRLARASEARLSGRTPSPGTESVYHELLSAVVEEASIDLRILVDILAGASAGGINAIFLGEAIATGRSLDPLTDLWLDTADVDHLLDRSVNPLSRFAKAAAAVPIAWGLATRSRGAVEKTVEPAHRSEVREKLANFVRARWFAPPFSGPGFTNLLLDALGAMAKEPPGPALLPTYQPLDLFVTVTDFNGFPQRLRLHSPEEVVETEHRLVFAFRDDGGRERRHLADPAELAFAARATASFPGAFPPFSVAELDGELARRETPWPGRDAFLARALPRHAAIGSADGAVLVDGSILANAPFRPAIDALDRRPARREVDRRFVYIDPKPGIRSIKVGPPDEGDAPGFFSTIFGALSDIPREQPIRDNLEAIDERSTRIRRLRHIVAAMRPEVEGAIERSFGNTFLLGRPSPKRLAAWRARAQGVAAREAGYAYSGYGHLKIAAVIEDVSAHIYRLSGGGKPRHRLIREAIRAHVQASGLADEGAVAPGGARADVIEFFRAYDLTFRTRRLRFLARRLGELDEPGDAPHEAIAALWVIIHDLVALYRAPIDADRAEAEPIFREAETEPAAALAALAARLDLKAKDDVADARLAEALAELPKAERRTLILAYLGFPFYDIATLPLLQGEGLDEFEPVHVDRISPDDATAIRAGGAAATLKGIQFHSFGAFFSRAYRENDYLWGRLHGADRLIDIAISALPEGRHLAAGRVAILKRDAFRAILAEERDRLTSIAPLFAELDNEVG